MSLLDHEALFFLCVMAALRHVVFTWLLFKKLNEIEMKKRNKNQRNQKQTNKQKHINNKI